MKEDVTIVIPVGPYESNKRWLREAIESVREQTYTVNEILVVDDKANLGAREFPSLVGEPTIHVYKFPWRLGVAHAFNFGVALAKNELVFLLGSDDWLEPTCIERCVKMYEGYANRDRIYFYVPLLAHFEDGTTKPMLTRSGAAFVTKSLWEHCGGFPVWSALCCPDVALYTLLDERPELGNTVRVGNKPLYHYRDHPDIYTARLRNYPMPEMTLNGKPASLVDLMRILATTWGNV